MAKYLVGCFSGWGYEKRRQLCLTTWFRDAQFLGIDVVFVMAEPRIKAPERYDKLLVLPCLDTYKDLPARTRWFCIWASGQQGWTHLIKLDDDTYMSSTRIAIYEPSGKCVGCRNGNGKLSGGAGYILDRDATAIVATHLTRELGIKHHTNAEDVLAAIALKNEGITPTFDKRFVGRGSATNRPCRDNNIITTHRISDNLWHRTHEDVGLVF